MHWLRGVKIKYHTLVSPSAIVLIRSCTMVIKLIQPDVRYCSSSSTIIVELEVFAQSTVLLMPFIFSLC